jgi:RHS repeat-associated protein
MGKVWRYSYDGEGNISRTELPSSGGSTDVVTNTYDALGRLKTRSYSDATPSISYEYDANGNRTAMTDALGTETRTYDALDRLASVQRDGDSSTFDYDPDGHITTRQYPGEGPMTYTYDGDGRMASATQGNRSVTYEYDAAGNRTKTTLPGSTHLVETRTYDAAGRPASVTTRKGTSVSTGTTYAYDAAGNPVDAVDSHKSHTAYVYDAADRLLRACYGASTCSSAKTSVAYGYDQLGNRTTQTTSGGTTAYTYDADDELTGRSGAGGSVAYAYDPRGNMVSAGTRKLGYDMANDLTSVTDPLPPVAYQDAVRHDGPIAYWRLDESSGATAVDGSGASHDATYEPTVTRGATGLLTKNADKAASFDGADAWLTGPPLGLDHASFSLEAWIKPSSPLTSSETILAADGGPGAGSSLRLRVTADGKLVLDFGGEALTTAAKTIKAGTTADVVATYDTASDTSTLLVNGTKKASSAAGPFVGGSPPIGIGRYNDEAPDLFRGTLDELAVYDHALDLDAVSAHYKAGKALSNGSNTIAFAYDGEGNRLRRTAGSGVADETDYLWDPTTPGVPQIALERDANGNHSRSYWYGANRISMSTPTGDFYYQYDRLNSVLRLSSATGATEWNYGYYPFGNAKTTTKVDPSAPINPMQFDGEYNDDDGLYDLRARQYDPSLGRFTSIDPLESVAEAPMAGTYAFVGDMPTVHSDPSGKCVGPTFFVCLGVAQYVATVVNSTYNASYACLHLSQAVCNEYKQRGLIETFSSGAQLAGGEWLTGARYLPAQYLPAAFRGGLNIGLNVTSIYELARGASKYLDYLSQTLSRGGSYSVSGSRK